MQGILTGSAAPMVADYVLLSEFAMGLALVTGGFLARRRCYRAHAWCQSAVVLLNLLIVAPYMVPSFGRAVAPGLVAHIGRSYYWLATAHGVLGISAELLGLHILLAAGTNILPPHSRFVRYKRWMRSAFGLWWLVLLHGLANYVRWYGVPFCPPASAAVHGADGAAATTSSLADRTQ
jgi:uncharacterized membrane protein YozB (DUF420 family)